MIESVVFDTSALLAFVDNEEGADQVEELLLRARKGRIKAFACFVTLTEMRYVTIQEKGEASADYIVALAKSWPVEWVQSDENLCLLAARYKACCRLSLADAFVAALAFRFGATLLHKDPEFEALSTEIELMALPYKSRM